MEITQSYNHFMPQSILKSGWGYKKEEKTYVNILNYDRLRDFVNKNPKFSETDLISALKDNFGETEDINRNGLVIRRTTERIMGNRLVLNLTEKNFGNEELDIEKNIERVISDSLKRSEVENNNVCKFYDWVALQKARSIAELMNIYSYFLHNKKIKYINSLEKYKSFKYFYNKHIHDYFNIYRETYYKQEYRAFIPQFNQELFLFLGELNTIHGKNFVNCLLYQTVSRIHH